VGTSYVQGEDFASWPKDSFGKEGLVVFYSSEGNKSDACKGKEE